MSDELARLQRENEQLRAEAEKLRSQSGPSVPPEIQLHVRQEIERASHRAIVLATLIASAVGALAVLGLWQGLSRYVDGKAKSSLDYALQTSGIRTLQSEMANLGKDVERVQKVFKEVAGVIVVEVPVPIPLPEPPVIQRPKPPKISANATPQETLLAMLQAIEELDLYSRKLEIVLEAYRPPKKTPGTTPTASPR